MGGKSARRREKRTERGGVAGKQPADEIVQEVEQLVWALVDERITAPQIQRLETLVLADARARMCYIRALQLHADLQAQLTAPPRGPDPSEGLPLPPLALGGLSASEVRSSLPDG